MFTDKIKNEIENKILSYCEGVTHVEFNINDIGKMVTEIESVVKNNVVLDGVMLSLLKVAKCPSCDGSGAIPHEAMTPNGSEVDWEQCQWCDEQKKIIDSEA